MSGYYFHADYCEVATLRSGERVHVRLLKASDKDRLERAFERLSPESRYRRFFSFKQRLSDQELRYLTEIDQFNHFAICAETLDADGTHVEGVAVARFIRDVAAGKTAEAAITVVDEFQGKGVGSLLFQRLIAAARERGVTHLRFEVLSSNTPMQHFLHEHASGAVAAYEGGIATIDFELPELAPDSPPDQPPRHNPLYKLLVLVAQGAIDLQRAADNMAARLKALPPGNEAADEAE